MSPPPTDRTTVKRKPQRGAYDRATIDKVLDEALICHVGFTVDGQIFVLPMIHVRIGDKVYLHGSPASRMLQTLQHGVEACLTVTLLDGLVLARSAMHHSMNYRSAVLFGTASLVEGAEKALALHALTEHLIPGRWADVRKPTEREYQQTLVLAFPIQEASAKVRTGPPVDDEEDYELTVWAGVVPLQLVAGTPIPDPRMEPKTQPPWYATAYPGPKCVSAPESD
jgi:nitroimidazol reductase NimA-like FMN-containing flavoprotein (pyridoxamine 5'-phosphate oxidase superfamily)